MLDTVTTAAPARLPLLWHHSRIGELAALICDRLTQLGYRYAGGHTYLAPEGEFAIGLRGIIARHFLIASATHKANTDTLPGALLAAVKARIASVPGALPCL